MLRKFLAILAAIGGALAWLFSAKARRYQAEAKEQRQRAEQAEASAELHRRLDQDRAELAERHREETQNEKAALQEGRRDVHAGEW